MEHRASRRRSFSRDVIDSRPITACQRCRKQKLKCSRDRPDCVRCKRLQASCIYLPSTERQQARIAQEPTQSAYSRIGRNNVILNRQNGTTHTPVEPQESPAHQSSIRWQVENNPSSVESYNMDVEPRPILAYGDGEVSASNNFSPLENGSLGLVELSPDSYPTYLHNSSADERMRSSSLQEPHSALPSQAVGLSLLEIYFARVYNAPLLFFKPVLFHEYVEGTLPDHLLRAIFALASLFLLPKNTESGNDPADFSELQAFSAFHSRGPSWAEAATKEAMALTVDGLSLPIIQTLECVSLYWFGIGNSRNGSLCLTMAYRGCYLLGWHKSNIQPGGKLTTSLESELQRRCLWACWASMCISGQPENFLKVAWSEVTNIPLPANILKTPSGWEATVGQRMSAEWHPVYPSGYPDVDSPPPIMAFVVRLVGVWAKIQLYAGSCLLCFDHKGLENLSRLSDLLTTVYEGGSSTTYRSHLRNDTNAAHTHQLVLFDALYHMCQMALHSTAVPLFFKSSMRGTIDENVVRNSAKTVLHHAKLFAKLLEFWSHGDLDITYMSPFLGYGTFVTGTVLTVFESSQRLQITNRYELDLQWESGESMSDRVSTIQTITDALGDLRSYWPVLRTPWEKLRDAVAALSQDPTSVRLEAGSQSGANASREKPQQSATAVESPGMTPAFPPRELFSPSETHCPSRNPETLESSFMQPLHQPINTKSTQQAAQDVLLGRIQADDEVGIAVGESNGNVDFPECSSIPSTDWWNVSFATGGLG